MGLLSILPEGFAVVESWIARVFLAIGVIIIFPWIALLVYDFFLYMYRCIVYYVPFFGGRARGQARPRAPSLKERPNGRPRRFSLRSPETRADSTGTFRADAHRRQIPEERYEDD